jgi:two-component system, sensor histidine kinase and response regulator
VFDRNELLARVEGDEELLAEVVGLFLEDCPRLLEDVGSAVASGDAGRIFRTAHALKGAAGNFAAASVVEAARRLEGLGRGGTLAGVPEAYAELEALTNQLCRALEPLRPGVLA